MSDQWNPEPDSTSSGYKGPSHLQTLAALTLSSDQASSEQVRSRWTPKPEQILILESIFNSGMVNPPRDETMRIRRLLQKFGPVADANVFYWFQNRRSRSRRRQRQIQANMEANAKNAQNTLLQYDPSSNLHSPSNEMMGSLTSNSYGSSMPPFLIPSSLETLSGSASSSTFGSGFGTSGFEGFFSELGFGEMEENRSQGTGGSSSVLCTSDHVASDLQYQQPGEGFVTVFINGVPTEVPLGPLDMNEMCGQDLLLVHSSGFSVPVNEYGFSTHSLQHGENYFLVGKTI